MTSQHHSVALQLRPASLDDAELLFSWRNDPATRSASHHSEELVFDEHVRWLKSTLENDKRKLYVAVFNDEPVGSVRADQEEAGYELSWTVAPSARGKGFGSVMVRMLAELLRSPVRAEIKEGNMASVKIAEFAGMRFQMKRDNVLHYSLSPEVEVSASK